MSSNFRPTNMFGSYNNRLPQGKINPTKGSGINSFPIGNTAKDIRGFTNKDYTNDMPAPFGKARPIKHFRKGRIIPNYIEIANPDNKNEFLTIDYNEMRNVRSSVLNKMISQMLWLPGSYSVVPNKINEINNEIFASEKCKNCIGTSIVSNYSPITNLTEKPEENVTNKILCCNEEYKAKKRVLAANTISEPNYYTGNFQYLQNRCQTFKQRQFNFIKGTELTNDIIKKIISSIYLNPNTIDALIETSKPGSPLSYFNQYVGQCFCNGAILETTIINIIYEFILGMLNKGLINSNEYNLLNSLQFKTIQNLTKFIYSNFQINKSNILNNYIYDVIKNNKLLNELIEGPTNASICGKVYYKPNNYQFATQGAVMSSTQILKKNYETINNNKISNQKLFTNQSVIKTNFNCLVY